MQTLNISEVLFRSELSAEQYASLQRELRSELQVLSSHIHTSLPGSWEVHVSFLRDGSGDLIPSGENQFRVIPGAGDATSKVSALVFSLQLLLQKVTSRYPLAFVFARPGCYEVQSEPASPSLVASPQEERLQGEYVPENPRYTRKQWIVSERISQSFDDAVALIRSRDKIYRDWGFEEVDPNPRAVLCFYGPAGTGKTMGAHVLASELGKTIICAKYSQIESKYVGEAPKNLRKIFSLAKETESLLFFDEADSFLGKRIEHVTSGSEQAINSLRGEMLILLEEFRGVIVFATNLLTNVDRAFESRIISKIEFELPNAEARRSIILSKIPEKAPLDHRWEESQISQLVKISEGFSGRVIQNSILMGLVKAARRAELTGHDEISFSDMEQSFREQKEISESIDLKYRRSEENRRIVEPSDNQSALLKIASDALRSSADGENDRVEPPLRTANPGETQS